MENTGVSDSGNDFGNDSGNNARLNKVDSYSCHFRVSKGNTVIGWAASNEHPGAQVYVRISSASNRIRMLASGFRADLLEKGIHSTGYCGFTYDIGDWENKDICVEVVGEKQEDEVEDVSECRNQSSNRLFFIHTPKTAGTSFRKSAELFFGENAVERNYGLNSAETSSLVRETLLSHGDVYRFYREWCKSSSKMYTGHLSACPMANLHPIFKIAVFVREPVQQVISHYNHYVRWNDYQGSFEEFVQSPVFRNLQFRLLSPLPVNLIGCVGITEQYDESIDLFNATFGCQFETLKKNVNKEKTIIEQDEALVNFVQKYNRQDMALYDHCLELFAERTKFLKQGKAWCMGAVQSVGGAEIQGVAAWYDSHEPVTVALCADGRVHGEMEAKLFKAELRQFVLPRDGFIGFRFQVPQGISSEKLQVVVAETGQILREIKL